MHIPYNEDIGAQALRIAEKYRSDPTFRKEAERDSWAVVRELAPDDEDLIRRQVGNRELKVHFNTDKTLYVVLPGMPPGSLQSLEADDLSAIAGGGSASSLGTVGTAGTTPSCLGTAGTIGSASSKG